VILDRVGTIKYVAMQHKTARSHRAEHEAKKELRTAYQRFMSESEPAQKTGAGKDLIRAIFGKDALAEDPLL